MPTPLKHDLYVEGTLNARSRQDFASSLRAYVLNDVADVMRRSYEENVLPRAEKKLGRAPETGPEVHKAIVDDLCFKFYSSIRYNTQEMVWRSVTHALNDNFDDINREVLAFQEKARAGGGSLTLDPDLEIPENVSSIDVHLAPRAYAGEFGENDCSAGALYDHGLNIFAFGMMGDNLDDIGHSMANYIRVKYPDFKPRDILDLGCTIGHNTLAWKKTYPGAEVTGVDVAGPCLRYAHARAGAQGVAAHFRQMDATQLAYPDESFDVVFSSMLLHELSLKDIRKVLAEARRVLRPGGVMVNMELPANKDLGAYDGFYLDWDAYYNNEPFYKKFRDQDFDALCLEAGFEGDKLISFITPQYTYMSDADYVETVRSVDQAFGDTTGRLATGVQWFGFGAWK